MSYYDQVKEAADAIRARVAEVPQIAIVLGSGLGDFAEHAAATPCRCRTTSCRTGRRRASSATTGKLVVGTVRGTTIAALAGRCHLYEGHDLGTVDVRGPRARRCSASRR